MGGGIKGTELPPGRWAHRKGTESRVIFVLLAPGLGTRGQGTSSEMLGSGRTGMQNRSIKLSETEPSP